MYQGSLFQNPENKFGFVYLVTCNHPECNKQYIGRKFFYTNFGKKTKQKESDWRTYKTSSKYVQDAIRQYGIESFQFEIVQLFDTRAGVVSGEVELQWAARVLHATDDKGERLYWNQAIGNIKFIAKEKISEETRLKMSEWQKGERNNAKRPEVRAKMSISGKQKVMTEEQKHNMSKASARRGKPSINQIYTDAVILSVISMLQDNIPQTEIAKLVGISKGTVSDIKRIKNPRYKLLWESKSYEQKESRTT